MKGWQMDKRKIILFTLLFSSILIALQAETFRIRKTNLINLDNSYSEQTVKIGINDGISVQLPNDKTYIEGLELKIQIPKIINDWRDCVAFSIYDEVSPLPGASQIDYSGKKIYVTPLPQKLNWIVQIPLQEENSIKSSAYVSKINVIPSVKDNFTFFRFQPAMKGVPDETYEAELLVSVKPILKNLGELTLFVQNSAGEKLFAEIFIDDNPVILKNNKIFLKPGVHNLSVQNSDYRNEFRSIVIEQAKNTEVKLTLRSNDPVLKITAPANTQIFLDSKQIQADGKEFVVSEGDHTIRYLLGGYEMIRTVNIQRGKSYNVNLIVDMEISEE